MQSHFILPNDVAGDDGRDGAPLPFVFVEGGVVRERLRLVLVERPFQIRIDQSYIAGSAVGKRTAVEAQELRGLDRVEFDEPLEGYRFPLVD